MKFPIFSHLKRDSKKSGFTLIEIMVAISVMTVGILGIYALVPHVVSLSGVNLDRFRAVQLAREGIEIIRNIRDTNWLEQRSNPLNSWKEGLTNCSLGCEADYTTPTVEDPTLPSYNEGRFLYIEGNTGFYKYIDSPSEDDIKTKFKRKIIITPNPNVLNVKVQIIWPGKDSPFEVEENLYNWR